MPLVNSTAESVLMRKNSTSAQLEEDRQSRVALEEDISIHIFSSSATMVGVCLTVIGFFRIIFKLKALNSFGDDLLSVDALLFLAACLLSYWALRTRGQRRRVRTERVADAVFLVALSLMVVVCGLITYEFV
jgi:protein-S-isoprenylcysteine O-methyltransferase Ste14